MKLNKLFYSTLIVAASATLFSCKHEIAQIDTKVPVNSKSGVTVTFDEDAVAYKESKGVVRVPISAEGEMNGYAVVTLKITETGSNPAKEGTDFIVTSKTINVSPEKQTADVEITLVDNDEMNEPKTFNLEITSVQGANVGAVSTCTFSIRDNDSEFYEKLQGKWTLTGNGDATNVTIYGATDEEDPEYNKVLWIVGVEGYDWVFMQVDYYFDMTTKTGHLEIPFGTLVAEDVNFGLGGYNDVYVLGRSSAGATTKGSVSGTWSADFKKIDFDTSTYVIDLGIFNKDGSYTGYIWDRYTEFHLSK